MSMVGDPKLEIVLTAKEITGPAFNKVTGYAQKLGKEILSLQGAMTALAGAAGIGYLIKQNLAAADAIAKTADSIGITTDKLQEYQYIADRSGVSTQQLNSGLQAFSRRLGDLRAGTGMLNTLLSKNNEALKDQLTSVDNASDALDIFMGHMQGVENQSDRNALAAAAFGRTAGIAMTNMVDNIDTLQKRYKRLGLSIDEDLLRQSEKAKDSIDDLGAVISTSMTRAVITLAPEIARVADNMGDWVANNKTFLSQDVPDAVRNTIAEIKNLVSIYEAIPDYITGPAGMGLIGTVILGPTPGKVIAAISLINELAGMTGNSLQDLARKHNESGQAMINLWNSIAEAMGWTKEEAELVFHPIIRDSKPAADGARDVAGAIGEIQLAWMNLDAINLTDKELRMQVSPDSVAQTKAILAQENAAWSEHNEALAADWKEAHEKMYADTARMSDLSELKVYEYGKKAVKISEDTANAMEKAFTGWANGFSLTLNDMLWEADATFGDIAESFGRMITQMVIQKSVVEPLVGGITGSGIFANIFHDGGIVGQPAPQRVVSPDTFAGAPRLHNGLRGDEFPAILQKGETVIPKNASSGPTEFKVEITNKSSQPVKATQATAKIDTKRMVIGIVLEGLEDNTMGLRRALGGA